MNNDLDTIDAIFSASGTSVALNIDGANIDSSPIGATTPSTGAFSTLSATGTSTLTTVDINGGAIDGTTIGSSSASTGAFSTLSATGVLTGASLDISGDVDIDGTTNLDVVDIDGALTQDGGAVFNEASADVDFRVESNGNSNMLFVDGGNDRVGIGGTPNTLLHLITTGGTQLRLTAAADNYAYLEFGDTSDEDIGRIQYSNIDNHMAFHTNAAERLRIDNSGVVNIGTASGTQPSYFNSYLNVQNNASTSSSSSITITAGSAGYAGLHFGDSDNGRIGQVAYNNSDDALLFTANNSERMRITSTGVGIGTSSPSAPLNISATWSSNTTEQFRIQDNTGSKLDFFGYSNGGKGIQAYEDNGSTFYNLNLQPLGGNVGIGTSSPAQLLEVRELSTTAGVHFPITLGGDNHAAGYAVGLGLDPEGAGNINKIAIVAEGTGQGYSRGKLHFLLDSANDSGQATLAESRMVIQDDGKVGIGTSSPVGVFDVVVPNAKTAYGGDYMYLGKTNEASGYGAIQCFQVGATHATDRMWEFQTIDQGVANSGVIVLQKSGGQVAIGGTAHGSTLTVTGSFSKSSGSFRIPHPLPSLTDTKDLVHSFVEAPKADLIYRGAVDLVDGLATVNIDAAAGMTAGTFVLLCDDVQCFTTNEDNWDLLKGSVSGNILTIESQNTSSTATVSWLVIGERKDEHMLDTTWTDENGKVIVEPDKLT